MSVWGLIFYQSQAVSVGCLYLDCTCKSLSYKSIIWVWLVCEWMSGQHDKLFWWAMSQPLLLCFEIVIPVFFTHLSNHLSPLSEMCTLPSSKEFPLSFKWRQTALSWPLGLTQILAVFHLLTYLSVYSSLLCSVYVWMSVFILGKYQAYCVAGFEKYRNVVLIEDPSERHSSHVMDDLLLLHCFSLLCWSALTKALFRLLQALKAFLRHLHFLSFTSVLFVTAFALSVCEVKLFLAQW